VTTPRIDIGHSRQPRFCAGVTSSAGIALHRRQSSRPMPFLLPRVECPMTRALVLPVCWPAGRRAAGPSAQPEAARTDATRWWSVRIAQSMVDPVVQWKRILLGIRPHPGVQPANIHPTRSFAMLHAAIYDAVNAIESDACPLPDPLRQCAGGLRRNRRPPRPPARRACRLYPALSAQLDAHSTNHWRTFPTERGRRKGCDRSRKSLAASGAATDDGPRRRR